MKTQVVRCFALLMVVVVGQWFIDASRVEGAKTFRWKFQRGQVFKLTMTQSTTQTLTVAGKEVEIPTTVGSELTWRVDDFNAKDQTVNVTQTIDRMQISMEMPNMGKVEFDSDSKEEPVGLAKSFSGTLRPLIGAKMVMTMNDRGKVIDVKVPEEALAGFKGNPLAKQMMTPESLRQMITQGSIVLPEGAISKGHKWSSKATMKTAVGNMDIKSNFNYEGEVRRGNRELSKFLIDMDIQFEKADGPLAAVINVVEQDNRGTIYFDAAEGRMVNSSLDQKMTLQITVGNQKIDQKLKTQVKLTVASGAAK